MIPTKHNSITDEDVVNACNEYTERMKKFKREGMAWDNRGNSLKRLMIDTELSESVCLSAMKVAEEHGLIDYGPIFEVAWPTHKGLKLLDDKKVK